jgi:hypothetical protein
MTSRCQTFAKLRNRRNRLLGLLLLLLLLLGLLGSDLHFTQLIRQTSTFTVGGNQSIVRTYSLHIRVRTLPPLAMKRSIRAITTGSGTESSSSTAAPARDANLGPNDGEIHAS